MDLPYSYLVGYSIYSSNHITLYIWGVELPSELARNPNRAMSNFPTGYHSLFSWECAIAPEGEIVFIGDW
jgi:hypothetical protein